MEHIIVYIWNTSAVATFWGHLEAGDVLLFGHGASVVARQFPPYFTGGTQHMRVPLVVRCTLNLSIDR